MLKGTDSITDHIQRFYVGSITFAPINCSPVLYFHNYVLRITIDFTEHQQMNKFAQVKNLDVNAKDYLCSDLTIF